MSPEAQRIAIAEACGYRMVEFPYAYPSIEMIKARVPPEVFDQLLTYGYERIPDYLSDLNAMNEAEKVLTGTPYNYKFGTATYSSSQKGDYLQLLLHGAPPSFTENGCGKRGTDLPMPTPNLPHLAGGIYATAPQRAEAFLRTLNLWTE